MQLGSENAHHQHVFVLPVQVVEVDGGVSLSRGSKAVKFSGEHAYEVIEHLLTLLQPPGLTIDALLNQFAGPDRPKIEKILDSLMRRRLVVAKEESDLYPDDGIESAEDVFFWEFGIFASEIRGRFAEQTLHIIGINNVALSLQRSLIESGFTDITLIDAPMFRNLRLWGEDGMLRPEVQEGLKASVISENEWAARVQQSSDHHPTMLIGTSDFGGKAMLRSWNQWSVENKVWFFPVVLQQLVGSIGPLVVPGETPCYECLRGRENANMEDAATQRVLEAAAFEGQFTTGAHPIMPDLVAQHAAMELTKVFSGIDKGPIGQLISIAPLEPRLSTHKVLKLPFCPVCGTPTRHAGQAVGDET